VKDQSITDSTAIVWRDYLTLCKPKVVSLIVFTAIVGMFLATPALPSLNVLFFGALGIGLSASSAAVINHVLDAQIDEKMSRTKNRPLPQGKISQKKALVFSFILCVISMLMLLFRINLLTTILTFFSLIGYAVIYTVYLKRATPQNIVIGGAAGAAPPVLGWTAVTGEVHSDALILFLIIFLWTPPHFWALAIARKDDYEKANIPMLPVTHGNAFTRLFILNYTILLVGITILPYQTGMSGLIYLVTAIISGTAFLWYAIKLKKDNDIELPMRVFRFSIHYLTILFTALLIDHYLPLRISDLLI
jgi:protoheme IX farnesyltransferase